MLGTVCSLLPDFTFEIKRSSGVLPKEAMDEYGMALEIYRGIAARAR